MTRRFENKAVLVIGATGGLGECFARAFLAEGARLLLASRNGGRVRELAERLGGEAAAAEADITDADSLHRLAETAREWAGGLDAVINATGYDVRKPLTEHSEEEIRRSLDTNLLGAILLTRELLPLMKNEPGSTIVHMGGFADGRLAFPYYSVDVATRSGIFAFAESVNRELRLEGSRVTVTYFCPNAADTRAEEPFHPIWKEMGIPISTAEQVAGELLRAVVQKRTTYIMGGWPTRLFAKLNALFPRLADRLLLNRYGRILQRHLGGAGSGADSAKLGTDSSKPGSDSAEPGKVMRKAAIGLVILSFLLYGLLAAVPFLPVGMKAKALAGGTLVAAGEVSFWVGAIILGKELVSKYKKWMNPLYWFGCGKRE